MTTPRQKSNTSNDQVNTRMSVVEYKVDELKKGQDRIENKLDLINYVPITSYDSDQKDNVKIFATKEELKSVLDVIKPIQKLFWGIITAIVIGLVSGMIAFIVRGGIK